MTLLPTQKPHVSFSELTEFFSCSWKHYLHQILKIDLQLPSPILFFGLITHNGIENFLKTKEMNIDLALTKLTETFQEERLKTKDQLNNIDDESYQKFLNSFSEDEELKAKRDCAKILSEIQQFLDDTFPGWEFVEAEHLLNESIDDSIFKFKGYIDAIIRYPVKGKWRYQIIDWKTAMRPWPKEKRQDQMLKNQLVFYKFFWHSKHKEIPIKDIRCGFVVLNKSGKPGKCCELIMVSVGDVTINRSNKLIKNMFASLIRGIKVKNRYSCKYCEYFNTQYCDSKYRFVG